MRIFKWALVLLVLLTAAVTGAELLWGRWLSADPLDLLALERDSAQRVDTRARFADGEEFILRYDHWGVRGEGGDPARIDLLSLGGDAAAQPLLPDDKTWQASMQAQFLAAQQSRVIVANAARPTQDSAGVLAALRQWLIHVPGLHPRFVLVMVGDREMVPATPAPRTEPARFLDLFKRKSALWHWWGTAHPPVIGAGRSSGWPMSLGPEKAGEWHDLAAPALDRAVLDEYRQRLKQIADEIHDKGAVAVFVTIARGDLRLHGGKMQELPLNPPVAGEPAAVLAAFNAATREACRENGFLCLDLAREVSFEPGDFSDYLHTSPAGAEKIGRWLYGKLAGLV